MEDGRYSEIEISGYKIRRQWIDDEWRYCIIDVIAYITRCKNCNLYARSLYPLKGPDGLKISDCVKELSLSSKGGKRYCKCSNLEGLYWILKVIPNKHNGRKRIFKRRVE